MWSWRIPLCVLVLLLAGDGAATEAKPPSPIGVIVAIRDHERALLDRLEGGQARQLADRSFHRGTMAGQPVVLVRSPMGKIGVATTTSLLLARYSPKAIISVAPAGALTNTLAPGTLLVASSVVEHDTGSWADEGYRWPRLDPVPTDSHLLEVARQAATASGTAFEVGIVASGDLFIESSTKAQEIASRTGALAVDTSSAAVALPAAWSSTPVLLIRVITDHADARAGLSFDEQAHNAEATQSVLAFLEELLRRWKR